jgi:adenine-specific DNA-methyltransferase
MEKLMPAQIDLWGDEIADPNSENEAFLAQQLITYIGNKRSLLDFIGNGIDIVRERLGMRKIRCLDVFAGSGVVSRYLKRYSSLLIANDIENYTRIINECYLSNSSEVPLVKIKELLDDILNNLADDKNLKDGFIRELYSPKDLEAIEQGERCFYTPRNAKYLDTARQLIEMLPADLRKYFLAPLLSEASIHANTSGVFKGFYKNKDTGLGQFGGNNKDALGRILGRIEMRLPVFSNFDCEVQVHRGDANQVVECLDEVDLAYVDPPYNQHPYGSNYFMLNLLVDYARPTAISAVSGLPENWYRSPYNRKQKAYSALSNLVDKINAKYLLVSFNSEGYIPLESMLDLLRKTGEVEVLETSYNAFRGSRNLGGRDMHVKEYLYLVEKK